jgi:hypothetical protein
LLTLCLLVTSCASPSPRGKAEQKLPSLSSQFSVSTWLQKSDDLDSKEKQLFSTAEKLYRVTEDKSGQDKTQTDKQPQNEKGGN